MKRDNNKMKSMKLKLLNILKPLKLLEKLKPSLRMDFKDPHLLKLKRMAKILLE